MMISQRAFMKVLLLVSTLTATAFLTPPRLSAGQMTVKGTSKIGHKAELIVLTVSVDSKCYPDQASLLNATNGAAEKIKNVMSSFMNPASDSRDKILALPGYTTRSTLRIFEPSTNSNVVVCENGWHGKNSLVLKIANYEVWPSLQQAILDIADAYAQPTSGGVAATNVTLHSPTPQLYDDTIQNLQAKAQRQALDKASAQFKEIAKQCGLYNHRIVSLRSENPAPVYARTARFAREDNGEVSDFNPEYDQIFVEASWIIVWEFVDNGEGCAAPLELSAPYSSKAPWPESFGLE